MISMLFLPILSAVILSVINAIFSKSLHRILCNNFVAPVVKQKVLCELIFSSVFMLVAAIFLISGISPLWIISGGGVTAVLLIILRSSEQREARFVTDIGNS